MTNSHERLWTANSAGPFSSLKEGPMAATGTATVNVDASAAKQEIAEVKMQALEAENAALRAKLAARDSLCSVEPMELKTWTPPRYRYVTTIVFDLAALGQQLSKEMPEGFEVFAIPSERVIVYRQVIDEPEETTEAA